MTSDARVRYGAGVTALCLVALLSVLATPGTAHATPLLIGEFFFDLPDGVSPTVHLSNDSTGSFDAFTITFVNDIELGDGSHGVDTQSVDQSQVGPLDAFNSIQSFPDLPPSAVSLTQLTAALSNFVFSVPGAISFSQDGGTTFESSALLDLTAEVYGFGIFVEVPEQTDPSPVPEPGTLVLLASGAAASALRRRRFAAAVSFVTRVARSTVKTHP